MQIKNFLILSSLSATIISIPDVIFASTIGVQLPYNDFGHVYNTDDGTATGNPVGLCASTATINSFRFLENRYPQIYDNKLTGGANNIVNARNQLAGLIGCANERSIWEGKITWIETRAPGTTIFEGMVNPGLNISTWNKNQLLMNSFPVFNWLFDQLKNEEDVEIIIFDPNLTFGHALTLTSLSFQDSMDGSMFQNNQWDPGVELATIDYLDPNNPSQLFMSNLQLNPNNSLGFIWNNGGANPATEVFISSAFKESPRIPEPSTLLGILIIGGLGIHVTKRKPIK